MKSVQSRCNLVAVALSAAAFGFAASHAAAQAYPAKPVQIVLPYSAGGSTDVIARAVAKRLGDAWGKNVIVDNRPGASGMIGAEIVAKADPDGYTLLSTTSSYPATAAVRAEAAVRCGEGDRPACDVCARADAARGAPVPAGKIREGTHRIREKEPRQAQLLVLRHRRQQPLLGCAVRLCRGHQAHARAVQGHRAGGAGGGLGRGGDGDLELLGAAADGQCAQGAHPRREQPRAFADVSGRAVDRAVRCAGLPIPVVVGSVRPGGPAGRTRGVHQCRGQQVAGDARHEEIPRHPGHRGVAANARRRSPICCRRKSRATKKRWNWQGYSRSNPAVPASGRKWRSP